MSSKHYFPDTAVNTLVPRALRALVAANQNLSLIESERVVYKNVHNPLHVSVISGGGSGHEPAWAGYVGDGLLSAAACGDIFASPSMKQVLTAINAVPSHTGTILMITNYTGDKLHFGLAAERALAAGLCQKVVVLPATDDVSIGKSKCGLVGRRGLAGHMITMKIVCAAAAGGHHTFEDCVKLGEAVNAQLVSIGSALDHCHVPGRPNHETIPDEVCVVGAGIHNEPGAEKVSPFPTVEELISHCLSLLCDPNDRERGFVNFKDSQDITVLLINNYGGLSNLELGALMDEIINQLDTKWHIKPRKIYCGAFETSLNGPGFSISLGNLTKAAAQVASTVEELLDLLGKPTTAPCWPNAMLDSSEDPTSRPQAHMNDLSARPDIAESQDILIDPTLLDRIVRSGCEAAIASEPDLTKWDMIMGDGDCGEAVKNVSEVILHNLDDRTAERGSVYDVLYSTIAAIDDMGGTLGAILGILLSAFASSLRATSEPQSDSRHQSRDSSSSTSTASIYATALTSAIVSLKTYTAAREGDRTVMDVLIPFADAFAATHDFGQSVRVAGEKAKATRSLKPRFGRATYVGAGEGQEVPDPGSWAVYMVLKGMADAMVKKE